MNDNNSPHQLASALDTLESAWQELQQFGVHPGPCTFGPPCTECGVPSGRCDHHATAMATRMQGLDAAITTVLTLVRVANSHHKRKK